MLVDGKPVRKINHQGDTFLPVAEGDVFTIRVQNTTRENVVAIVSVDGRSVMTGDEASHNDSGYLVRAGRSTVIEGYRRGMHKVKEFKVGRDYEESYGEKRSGSDLNDGVIGVAIIPEQKRIRKSTKKYMFDRTKTSIPRGMSGQACYPDSNDNAELYSSMDACSLDGKVPTRGVGSVGTVMGEEKESHVHEVDVDIDYNRKSVVVLYYDTVPALRAMGVPVDTKIGRPNPFPAEPDHLYCPDA